MKETTNERAVEAVARAIAAVEYAGANVQLDAQLADSEIRAMAQAALAAARPLIMKEAAGMVQARYDNAPWNAMGDQFKAAIEDLRTAAKTDGGGA